MAAWKTVARYRLLLFVLITFHLLNNYFWIKSDAGFPRHDENQYFLKSLSCFRVLTDGEAAKAARLLQVEPKMRPHLFPLTAVPFYMLAEVSYDTACLSNGLFLVLVIIGVFLAGKSLRGPATGFWAAFLVSFYPFVVRYSRLYWSEIALMGFFALSVYLLLKTDTFTRRGWALGLGLAIGLGMLVKQIYAFFIFTPLLIEGIRVFLFPSGVPIGRPPVKTGPRPRFRPSAPQINFVLCILLGAGISVPYYLHYFSTFATKFSYNVAGGAWEPVESVFSLESFLWYLGHIQEQISLFFFLLLIIFFLAAIFNRGYRVALLLVTLAGSYLILSFFPTKDARFVSTLLPLCALITAAGIVRLKNPVIKSGLLSLVVIVAILNFLQVSWNLGPFNIPYHKSRILLPLYDFELHLVPPAYPPQPKQEWAIEAILDDIVRDKFRPRQAAPDKILVAPYLPDFNVNIFNHHAALRDLPLEFVDSGTRNLYHYNFRALLEAGYLIGKTGDSVPFSHVRFEYAEETNNLLNDPWPLFQGQIRLLSEYELPDGSRALVYQRTAPPGNPERIAILEKVLTLEPGHPWAWQALGETLLKEGRLDRAREAFLKVTELLPDWAGGYVHLGGVYLEQGRLEPAFQQIRLGLERAPDWPYAHYLLGAAYERSGRIEAAVEEYNYALREGKHDLPAKAEDKLRKLGLEPELAPEAIGE